MRRTLFKASPSQSFLLTLTCLAVLAAGLAFANWVAPYTYKYEMATCPYNAQAGMCLGPQACTVGTCTGTAPTGSGEGMLLSGVSSYRLRVCAAGALLDDAGTNPTSLSGAGTLQAYWRDAAEATWIRNPGLDQSVTVSGVACQVFPDFVVGSQIGRVRYVASGVTVSDAGTYGSMNDGGPGIPRLDVLLDGYAATN